MKIINKLKEPEPFDDVDEEVFCPELNRDMRLEGVDEDVEGLKKEILESLKQYKEVKFPPKSPVSVIAMGRENLEIISLVEKTEKGNELKTVFPYVPNKRTYRMELDEVIEFTDGLEAVMHFYSDEACHARGLCVDYMSWKHLVEVGNEYDVALSAIAYDVWIDNEDYYNFRAQIDEEHPDAMQIWAEIVSEVNEFTFLGRKFYRMDICIDEEENTVIPVVVNVEMLEEKPKMGDKLKGDLWIFVRLT